MAYREPLSEDLDDPLFDAIWMAIKNWDVNIGNTHGYSSTTGNHVMMILDEVRETLESQFNLSEDKLVELLVSPNAFQRSIAEIILKRRGSNES